MCKLARVALSLAEAVTGHGLPLRDLLQEAARPESLQLVEMAPRLTEYCILYIPKRRKSWKNAMMLSSVNILHFDPS
jgi:hypothetical protein